MAEAEAAWIAEVAEAAVVKVASKASEAGTEIPVEAAKELQSEEEASEGAVLIVNR